MDLEKLTNNLLEDMLSEMGGNVFTTERIAKENVEPTVEEYKKQILSHIPHDKVQILGSGGKKESSGDIDLGLQTSLSIDEIVEKLEDLNILYKRGGSQIWTAFPQYGPSGKKIGKDVQVDIMPGNLNWMETAYWAPGSESKYKGAHRNILLNAALHYASEQPGDEGRYGYSIDWGRGVNKKLRFKKKITRGKNKGKTKEDSKIVERGVMTSWDEVADFLTRTTDESWKKEDFLKSFEKLYSKVEKSFDVPTFEKIKNNVRDGIKSTGLDMPKELEESVAFDGFLGRLTEEMLSEANFGKYSGKGVKNRKPSSSKTKEAEELRKALKDEFPNYDPMEITLMDKGEYTGIDDIPEGGEVFYDVNNRKQRGILQVILPGGIETEKYVVINPGQNVYGKSSNMTSKIHETSFGIFIINPNASITDAEEYRNLVKDVYGLKKSKIPQISDKKEEFPDNIIRDAERTAKKFRERFVESSIANVVWSADNTKENNETGPADIVAEYSNGEKQYISLKKGAGQLASLSPSDIATIIKDNIQGELEKDSILKWMEKQHEDYSSYIKNMTKEWAELMINIMREDDVYDNELKESFIKDLEKINSYSGWTAIRSKHKETADYFATKVTKGERKHKEEWERIRRENLIPAMKIFVDNELKDDNSNIDVIEKKLKDLFKKSFRIFDKPYIYVAKSGEKMFVVPSDDDFESMSENLSFEYDIKENLSDFKIIIIVKIKEKLTQKVDELLKFNMTFRWTQKQMSNSFTTTASAPELLADEDLILEYLFPDSVK